MSILRNNTKYPLYKPMKYEWAYEAFKLQQAQHWITDELTFGNDVRDYHLLPEPQKELLKNILRLFTQNDVEALHGYSQLLGLVRPTEIKMWVGAVINMESEHVNFYSTLTDTLGFPDEFYEEFIDVPVMERKIDYLEKAKVKKFEDYKAMGLSDSELDKRFRQDVLRMVAVFAAGLENIELFAQFALLIGWSEDGGKFPGSTQGNIYTARDEALHGIFNSKLFLELAKENPDVYSDEVKSDIRNAIIQVSEQEIALADYLYDNGEHPTISREAIKEYVKFMTDRALRLLELPVCYHIERNPLPFMDEILSNVEFANFFEVDVTSYSKNNIDGDWADVTTNDVDFIAIKHENLKRRYDEN